MHNSIKSIFTALFGLSVCSSNCLAQLTPDWEKLREAGLQEYRLRLRSAGVPEQLAQDLLLGEIERDLCRELVKTGGEGASPFWQASFDRDTQPAAALESYSRSVFFRQKIAKLRDILGDSASAAYEDTLKQAVREARFKFLPPTKRAAVAELKKNYEELLSKVITGAPPEPAELTRLSSLRAEFDARLSEVMTSGEKREYDFRFSLLAAKLRSELALFRPSEQEFRIIFALRQEHEAATSGETFAGLPSTTKIRLVTAASAKLSGGLTQALGSARFRDYQRIQSQDYLVLLRFLENKGLNAAAASAIFDVREEAQKVLQEVLDRADLDGDQKKQFMQSLRVEAEKAVRSTLGAEVFGAFLAHPTGAWLQALGR